jgi:hypothetical protein
MILYVIAVNIVILFAIAVYIVGFSTDNAVFECPEAYRYPGGNLRLPQGPEAQTQQSLNTWNLNICCLQDFLKVPPS